MVLWRDPDIPLGKKEMGIWESPFFLALLIDIRLKTKFSGRSTNEEKGPLLLVWMIDPCRYHSLTRNAACLPAAMSSSAPLVRTGVAICIGDEC